MMNINLLHKYLQTIFNNCDRSLDKANKLANNFAKYTINDIIRIDNFAFDNELSQTQAETILDTLCEMNIMQVTKHMYKCPNCGTINILEMNLYEDKTYCNNCRTIHSYTTLQDIEPVYSLVDKPELKLFKVTWRDKRNDLMRHADIIAYTRADAESVIHENYHYVPNSIKVSSGIEIENKMLLKEYN